MTDSNNFLWHKGVEVSEATTNVITNPTDPTAWSMSESHKDPEYGFAGDEFVETVFGVKGYQRSITSADWRATLIWIPWTTPTDMNIPHTFSIYARALSNFTGSAVNLNYQGTDADNNRVDISQVHALTDNRWKRISLTAIPANHNFAALHSSGMKVYTRSTNGQLSTIEIALPQMEQKAFPTAFTVGSRSAGSLMYPFSITGNTTFHIWHEPYMPTTEQTNQASSPNIFQLGNYHNNDSLTFWCWYPGTIRTYIRANHTGWTNTITHTTLNNTDWLKPHQWTLVLSGTTGWENYKVYHNGDLLTNTNLATPITSISGSFFGMGGYGGRQPNAKYGGLALYNKALNEQEIQMLVYSKFQVKNNGNFITEDVVEEELSGHSRMKAINGQLLLGGEVKEQSI